MNLRLTDELIRSTCRDLKQQGPRFSGRALRRALRDRFGAAGKTERVFAIWRQETQTPIPPPLPALPTDVGELQVRLRIAETASAELLARAELAEYRERAHQDHWALEIDRLREEQKNRPKMALELRTLQEQVLRLNAELNAARALNTQTD